MAHLPAPTTTMTETTTVTDHRNIVSGNDVQEEPRIRWPWSGHTSARRRILGWYVLLLAVALGAALFIQRSLLLDQVITNADQALDQEVAEFRQMADGRNPATGEPFGAASTQIFDVFLEQNVPVAGEGVVTITNGSHYKSDVAGSRFRDTQLMSRWAQIQSPERDQVDTDAGPIRYLAVPIFDGDSKAGAFVAVMFLQEPLGEANQVIRLGALIYGTIFIIAWGVAWVAAGEVLRPLRDLSTTARSISESDLDDRIPVEGGDELAELSRTFNDMLDRLQGAFVGQRRFVDDASHELRTPITIIRGQLELLDDDPEERERTVRLLTEELDRMSRIVDDMLTLAKVEQPGFINPHPTDLAEFMQQVAARGRSLGAHEITLGNLERMVIEVDEQRMAQAMVNLVKNAIVHNPPDTTIRLDAVVLGDEVRLSVSDNGVGIPRGEQKRIFDRFHRGSSNRQVSDGAGLGLAIVTAVVERHGGRVDLVSRSKGTTFTLIVPTSPRDGIDT